MEIQEFGGNTHCDDDSVPADYSVQRFFDLANEAFKKFGNTFRIADKLQEPLRKAGFTNISVRRLKIPIGPWAKVSAPTSLPNTPIPWSFAINFLCHNTTPNH